MSNYPTSDPSFTPKVAGQKIQAAHPNAIQDEVVAIGAALRGTLQHSVTTANSLIASSNLSIGGNSTLTGAVSVGGNSTLTGALQVGGNSTFAGTVNFQGIVTFTGSQTFPNSIPRVRVGISADQNLPAQAFQGINWVTEDYDSHAMHSTSANSSRITFVDSSGVYHVGASVDITNPSSGVYRIRILLGDSTAATVAANAFFANVAPGFSVPLAVSGDVRIADTTVYMTVQVFNGNTSTNSVTSTGSFVTAAWAHKVSS